MLAAKQETETNTIERDVMEYDVVTVGAGPAGLAFAIRLKQLNPCLVGMRDRKIQHNRRTYSLWRSDRTCPPG